MPLATKSCLVAEQENASRRSGWLAKKTDKEPEASALVIGHSYPERLPNEVPRKVGPEQEFTKEAEPEVSKNSATKIAISTPTSKCVVTGQATDIDSSKKSSLTKQMDTENQLRVPGENTAISRQ